jgi:hypothetical protein
MADSFYVIGSYRTVKVLSGQTVLDIEYVTCATIPTGITFAYGVPIDAWTFEPAAGIDLLNQIAVQLESLVTSGHVVSGSAVQDLDANGLLEDFVAATVAFDRSAQGLPPLYGTVNIPVNALIADTITFGGHVYSSTSGPSPIALVTAEYARLEQLAAA